MRVSTADQSLDLQRDALRRAGCERTYEDVCSGKAAERPGLARALDVAREGDAIVVWKLDRIGRSLPHVVGLVGDLRERGVGLKVDFLPESGGMRSEYHAAARIVTASMLARASAGVR